MKPTPAPLGRLALAVFVLLALLLAACVLSGCSSVRSEPLSCGYELGWHSDFSAGELEAWRREAGRRLTDPFVFGCHGDDRDGKWIVCPNGGRRHAEMRDVVQPIRDLLDPRRDLIVVACNPGGYELSIIGPGRVFYSRRIVWQRPGPDVRLDFDTMRLADCAGDIWDFIQATNTAPRKRGG